MVVPNGVDCGAIGPGPAGNGGPPVVVFSGDMSFEPNVDAALAPLEKLYAGLLSARASG